MQNNHFLDIVTDLKRSALCLYNGNNESSQAFLKHVNTISHQDAQNVLGFSIDEYLQKMSAHSLSNKQRAEKLLTLSSIIFSRTINSFASSSSR
ncbi:hypothetical protein KC726_00835 [Candidatus Woesebacteria bacterium]|nr:hypothetical protein [Candidatus Woesebacteria bacterium]